MSIASRITAIEEHIGDVYDTIDYSYDTTGVNKNIINIPKYLKKGYLDIINNGIDTLYNNFPKVSGIGSNLSLTPTYKAPIKLNEIQGDTLQNGTPTPSSPVPIQSVTGLQNVNVCGKNIFNSPIINGVVTNTMISNSNTRLCTQKFIKIKPNTTYTISFESNVINQINVSSFVSNTFPRSHETGWISNFTFTTSNYNYIMLTFRKSDDSNVSPSDISNIQLEVSSTATTYEPYTGNTYEVNLGKNLFDKSNVNFYANNNSAFSNTTDTNKTRVRTTSFNINNYGIKTNTTYVVSGMPSGWSLLAIRTYTDPSSSDTNSVTISGDKFTITDNSINYIHLLFGNANSTEVASQSFRDGNIQLEKGSQATSYSPYFTPIELNKIGDYKDRIYKDNGKWYITKNIGKVVLNGSEDWQLAANYTNNSRFTSPDVVLSKTTSLISDYFVEGSGGTDTTNIDTNGSTGRLMITIPNSIATTPSALTTWLTSHNTTVLYQLSTPTYTTITNTELIEQLESLYNAKSKNGTTNINVTSEDLSMILNVSVIKGDA